MISFFNSILFLCVISFSSSLFSSVGPFHRDGHPNHQKKCRGLLHNFLIYRNWSISSSLLDQAKIPDYLKKEIKLYALLIGRMILRISHLYEQKRNKKFLPKKSLSYLLSLNVRPRNMVEILQAPHTVSQTRDQRPLQAREEDLQLITAIANTSPSRAHDLENPPSPDVIQTITTKAKEYTLCAAKTLLHSRLYKRGFASGSTLLGFSFLALLKIILLELNMNQNILFSDDKNICSLLVYPESYHLDQSEGFLLFMFLIAHPFILTELMHFLLSKRVTSIVGERELPALIEHPSSPLSEEHFLPRFYKYISYVFFSLCSLYGAGVGKFFF